jgi:biopolymer transport protein TolR
MKKDLNFEINIIPILDVLSVLICFLLLTSVWTQIGSLDTKQAVGDNSTNGAVNPPSIWTMVDAQGNLDIQLRNIKPVGGARVPHEFRITSRGQGVDFESFKQRLLGLKAQIPDLKVGVIRPDAKVNYGDVIHLMDQLKQSEITDVGLSPLG